MGSLLLKSAIRDNNLLNNSSITIEIGFLIILLVDELGLGSGANSISINLIPIFLQNSA